VWNHPVVAYRMVGLPEPGRPDLTQVSCTIWYADDAVAPDFLGTKYLSKTYTYVLQGDYQSPKAAEWTGPSSYDHPHFAWHPAYAQSYVPGEQEPNPLRYDIVQKIAKLAAGLSN
jgi:hypothetical protein